MLCILTMVPWLKSYFQHFNFFPSQMEMKVEKAQEKVILSPAVEWRLDVNQHLIQSGHVLLISKTCKSLT